MSPSAALETLEKVLGCADAEAAVAVLHGGASSSTRIADNVITQNVQCRRVTLQVECAYGQSHGGASTDDLSAGALRDAVARAQTIARASPPDPEYMPPVEAAETAKYPRVQGFFEATERIGPEEKARQLAAAARKVQAAGMRLSGGYPSGAYFTAVANSAGLRAYHASTETDFHATVLGPSGSGWAEQVASNIADLDVPATAEKALAVAQAAQDPQPLEPGKYDAILSPAAVGELLLYMLWCGLDAKATDEGRTFLRGKLGTKVFGDRITIRSDPAAPRCPGSPFQGDGLVSPSLAWVENGVVRNLSYSRYWAKKQGRLATGWPSNFVMDGGDATVEQMIASTERGLLITRFWYIREVDPMIPLHTGMTRDGLFLIERGKVARPVQHMRFNENAVDMLNRVEMFGPAARTGEMPMLVPALKVRAFNFTSTTKF